ARARGSWRAVACDGHGITRRRHRSTNDMGWSGLQAPSKRRSVASCRSRGRRFVTVNPERAPPRGAARKSHCRIAMRAYRYLPLMLLLACDLEAPTDGAASAAPRPGARAAAPDAGLPDAGFPDAGAGDAGRRDAGLPDAGS